MALERELEHLIRHNAETHLNEIVQCDNEVDTNQRAVDVVVTMTCDGRLSYYLESKDIDEQQFFRRSLETCVDSGIHLVGYFKAKMELGEFIPFSYIDQAQAVDSYVDSKIEYINGLGEEMDDIDLGDIP